MIGRPVAWSVAMFRDHQMSSIVGVQNLRVPYGKANYYRIVCHAVTDCLQYWLHTYL